VARKEEEEEEEEEQEQETTGQKYNVHICYARRPYDDNTVTVRVV